MSFDLALPIYAASGLTLLAVLTYFGWPKVRLRTCHKLIGSLRVVEMALILSPRAAGVRGAAATSLTEFVVYVTFKTGNR